MGLFRHKFNPKKDCIVCQKPFYEQSFFHVFYLDVKTHIPVHECLIHEGCNVMDKLEDVKPAGTYIRVYTANETEMFSAIARKVRKDEPLTRDERMFLDKEGYLGRRV